MRSTWPAQDDGANGLRGRTMSRRRGAPIGSVAPGGGSIQLLHLLAYIDPGSGSLIIQAVIATLVAIPFFFREQIGRIVRTVRGGGAAWDTVPDRSDPAA